MRSRDCRLPLRHQLHLLRRLNHKRWMSCGNHRLRDLSMFYSILSWVSRQGMGRVPLNLTCRYRGGHYA